MVINYSGPSMNPTFLTGDWLNVIPYDNYNRHKPEAGDVIVFHPPEESRMVVHRIVSLDPDSGAIRTRGDNNNGEDSWCIELRDITGVVVSAKRGGKTIRIRHGKTGLSRARLLWRQKRLIDAVLKKLRPIYHFY